MNRLVEKSLLDVKTIGKELFAIFEDDICLRIHFLMNGSVQYNNYGKNKSCNPCLVLEFTKTVMKVFDSNVQIRVAHECLEKYETTKELDVCSSSFHHGKALKLLCEADTSKLVADLLMDQDILPGVGNIIKNEALFNSGINPNTSVKDLNKGQLSKLLKETRDFSRVFYEVRRKRASLHPHLRIYNKKTCSQCSCRLIKCKPGLLKRLTFFCARCQTNGTKTSSIHQSKEGQMNWTCAACTFLNSSTGKNCAMCDTHSPIQNVGSDKAPYSKKKCKVCLTPFQENTDICYVCLANRHKRPLSGELAIPSTSYDERTAKTNLLGSKMSGVIPIPLCTDHKVPCEEKQVWKSGPNQRRFFFSCGLRNSSRCNYFQWADNHFPRCKHNLLTVRRQVLKQNENNGRQFYTCSKTQEEQCDFFEWAD